MRFWRFTFYTVLGCLPWVFALTWLGYLLGERWETVERVMRPFAWAIAIGIVVTGTWFVWHRLRTIRREEEERRARIQEAETLPAQARDVAEADESLS
jgi:membrane protein DedA with SNARE-associated domain